MGFVGVQLDELQIEFKM